MTRRSSNKTNKQNRKAKAKRASSEHETSTDARNASETQTSTQTSSLQDSDSTPSPQGNSKTTRNTRSESREVSIEQPERMEIDDDSTPPAPTTSKTRDGGQGGRANTVQQRIRVQDEKSFYDDVFNCKTSDDVERVVIKWIENYQANKDHGLTIIMQFFLDASGCKGVITTEMENIRHEQLIRRMTEQFDEESADYPIVKAGPKFKKFKLNYCLFVQRLVYQCEKSILYDGFFMDNIISWLVGLSDTQVRAFRHTTTLAGMKMMSALADVGVMISIDFEEIRNQYDVESQAERNANKLESLIAQGNTVKKNLDEIKNMLSYIFKSIFVHRYRDILVEIRAICMEEIGVCMITFPQMFLEDTYLKYIGWKLHDDAGEVRLKCVQALQLLYGSDEWKEQLQDFTKHFKDRIVAMIMDKEYNVQEQAIKLVISMQNYGHTSLNEEECESLYDLVYCCNRAVAQAAAEFVNEKFFASSENVEEVTKSGKKRLPNTPFIKDFVLFSIESELPEHEPYLVDSLIEVNEMTKDWECMTDLLLEEPGPTEKDPLDNEKQTCLIKIMVCCIKQATTGEIPDGRGPAKRVLSAKETKQIQDDKQKMTEHFVGLMPLLLEKYRDDPEKLADLMSIPQYFELAVYSADEQEQHLDLLMDKITEIVDLTLDTQVLDEAAKTLEHMCNPESTIYAKCNMMKMNLIEAIINKYKDAINKVRSAIEEGYHPSDVDISSVQESLAKFACFFSYHDLNYTSLWDSLFQNIRDRVLPAEATKYSIITCFFSIIWSQSALIEFVGIDHRFDEKCKILKGRHRDFVKYVSRFIGADEVSMVIREEAYNTVCDLLVMFNNNLTTQENPQLHQLIYEPDSNLSVILNKFVQQRVFSDTEGDEERHKRRNFLVAFCKLIIFNVLPAEAAADVFKHYVEYGELYGDVIKMTISKARDNDKTKCALALQRSLNILYTELGEGQKKVETSSKEFKSLKELAKRFALFFGTDAVKNRDAIVALHKRGIMFAASLPDGVEPRGAPPNLDYLEILNEFTNKLVNQDKKTVLNFLNKHLQIGVPENDWQPLVLYRKALLRDKKADVIPDDLSVLL